MRTSSRGAMVTGDGMQACKSIPAAPALARSGRIAFSFKRLIFKDFITNVLRLYCVAFYHVLVKTPAPREAPGRTPGRIGQPITHPL